MISHGVLFTGRSQRPLPWPQNVFLIADPKGSLPLQHEIHFIFIGMDVPFLHLIRFKTVNVAEESRRFKHVLFFHFFTRKALKISQIDDLHSLPPLLTHLAALPIQPL